MGELRILRSFDASRNRISQMRTRLVILWIAAMLTGILLTYLLAGRLLEPVKALDRAAAEIGKGNYDVRMPVQGGDEIGRLAATFNSMCASIRQGREDLIRQERIFFRNIPLTEWVEHEMPFDQNATQEKLPQSPSVFRLIR